MEGQYGGLDVYQLKRMKELEEENNRLRRMFADLSLRHESLREAVEKSCNTGSRKGAGRIHVC